MKISLSFWIVYTLKGAGLWTNAFFLDFRIYGSMLDWWPFSIEDIIMLSPSLD